MNFSNSVQHQDWLHAVCQARGWDSPQQGPLCRIRLSPAEQSRAVLLVSRGLQLGLASRLVAAAVCVLACEALQQRPPGAQWKWTTVRDRMGPALMGATDDQLRDLVEQGLPVWGRPLRRDAGNGRLCLHSLVLEAGIPTALLAREDFRTLPALNAARRRRDVVPRLSATPCEPAAAGVAAGCHAGPRG